MNRIIAIILALAFGIFSATFFVCSKIFTLQVNNTMYFVCIGLSVLCIMLSVVCIIGAVIKKPLTV